MANYKFKGVSLSTILSQEPNWGFTNVPKYAGLGFSTSTFANSRVLPTGYSVDNADISNTARATHVKYNTNQAHINIPTGVNTIRVIARGGGGGGGGGGGPAIAREGDNHAVRGQTGGAGGTGTIGYGSFNVVAGHNAIAIQIGGGGNGGAGANGADVANGDVKAPDGKSGDPGGNSGVYYNSPAGFLVNGAGGAGGTGGTGGKAVGNQYGHDKSWSGAGSLSTGKTPFGVTPEWTNGDPGLATAGANGSSSSNHENNYANENGNVGGGGDGGYSYLNNGPTWSDGANVPGAPGGNGNAGSVTVFWLYG
jgi:hypothetical protein